MSGKSQSKMPAFQSGSSTSLFAHSMNQVEPLVVSVKMVVNQNAGCFLGTPFPIWITKNDGMVLRVVIHNYMRMQVNRLQLYLIFALQL